MAANPLVSQGTLNRIIASVSWSSNNSLNVTAPFLGKDGISLTLQGAATTFIPTMTGAVTAPEPYQMVELTMHLLKTQPLAQAYKAQMETSTLLGDGTVRADTTTLGTYEIVNCAIQSISPLKFSGEDAGFIVTIGGYYLTNSNLWG